MLLSVLLRGHHCAQGGGEARAGRGAAHAAGAEGGLTRYLQYLQYLDIYRVQVELELGLERSAAEVASLDTRLLQLEQGGGGGGDTLGRVQPLQEAALPDLSVDRQSSRPYH